MTSPRDEMLAILRQRAEAWYAPPRGDWLHVERVYGLARRLARQEEADRFVVGAAALLHDLRQAEDAPGGNHAARAAALARGELARLPIPDAAVSAILDAIVRHADTGDDQASLETRVLQDAHRLDDLGALGIARALEGSTLDEPTLYERGDPFAVMRDLVPDRHLLDQLFARMLTLPRQLHTPTARAIANRRVALMLFYFEELRAEFAETLPDALLPEENWLVPEEGRAQS